MMSARPPSFTARVFALLLLAALGLHSQPLRAQEDTRPRALKPIESLAEGPPAQLGRTLGPTSFVPYRVRKLARARVVWVNFRLLRELGIEIPPDGLNPEWERRILDAFAWWVPRPVDPQDAFTDEWREIWALRYGGKGIADGFGGARNGLFGQVDSKSSGVNSLIGASEGDWNEFPNKGTGALANAANAAIHGETMTSELPNESNRTILIIEPGLTTKYPLNERYWGGTEINGIEIRLPSDRAAAYMWAEHGTGPLQQSEAARLSENARLLTNALPQPPGATPSSERERLRSGMLEWARRLGRQYGAADAEGIYHGATSPSNGLLGGGFMDVDNSTSLPALSLAHNEGEDPPFRSRYIREHVIFDFHEELERELPPELRSALPSYAELRNAFLNEHRQEARLRMIERSGVPIELARRMRALPESQALGQALLDTALAGARPRAMRERVPEPDTTHDLAKILELLARRPIASAAEAEIALAPLVPELRLRKRLAAAHFAYRRELLVRARADGISERGLLKLLGVQAELRNRERYHLRREVLKSRTQQAVDWYGHTGDRTVLWNSIDERIALSRRRFESRDPYRAVLGQWEIQLDGKSLSLVYDARADRLEAEVRVGGLVESRTPAEQMPPAPFRALQGIREWVSLVISHAGRCGDALLPSTSE
ncbi:MAG TPA: hypothetical protein VM598_12680 [Bdellovibrionota bacterium]|nr:hypothetical protein [Bdellovibrionota bacterium]